MLSKVSFFTPVIFYDKTSSTSDNLLEIADDYFFWGGKKAYVLPAAKGTNTEETVLCKSSPSFLNKAIKIFLLFTVIVPAIMLISKLVLRSQYTFSIIKAKQKLEEGIDLPQETVDTIQRLVPKIVEKEEDPEIIWYSNGNNLVFSLRSNPNLVFKLVSPHRATMCHGRLMFSTEYANERFAHMKKAYKVCLEHHLDRLKVPHAKLFEVALDDTTAGIIAEERLDIESNTSAQEQLWQQTEGMEETLRQLCVFIKETGFCDVVIPNVPIIRNSHDVAVIDVEHMGDAAGGFFGTEESGSCGLVGCVFSEKQLNFVLSEAQKQGIIPQGTTTVEEIRKRILKQIQENNPKRSLAMFRV